MFLFFVKKKRYLYYIMDYMTRLNAKNNLGLLNLKNNKSTWINVICVILLIILIVLLIVCLVKGKDSFGDTHDEDLILMVTRKGCGFAAKAEELIKDNNMKIGTRKVKFIDMGHPKAIGVRGTPTFLLGDKQVAGFHPDLDELYNKLTGGNNSKKSTTNSSSKNHLMVGSELCPYCIKAKALLDKNGVKYDFIDSNSQIGKYKMLEVKATGVPVVITIDEEVIIGFDEEKLSQLK